MRRRDLLVLTPVLLFPGCSSTSAPKPEKKAAEPVTGLHALYQMYSHARSWAPDIKILRYSSIDISQVPREPGKAAAWQVIFASETLGQKRAYTFSVYEASVTLREGMFPESPSSWSADKREFLIAAAKIDTDEAWQTALKHGEAYSRKNPDMPISYTLELGRTINDPVWRVIWGESASSSAFSILIDASTGAYLETLS
jgi:hypothetical protein